MKVLFAIGSEQTSKRVAEKYYEKFGEELEYKNVFYFQALLNEVKADKTYDRIVISEELEEFVIKNNVEAFDRLIFNKIDSITDEIEDSEIIVICSDRRSKNQDRFVERLFSIGVYNILIGDERNVESLCNCINKPLNKKEAKRHLNINPVVSNSELSTRDDEVEEVQMLNILKYYDGIKGKVDEYVPAFDRIAEQYSQVQLKVIASQLPADVKRELLKSERYIFLSDVLMPRGSETPQKNNVIKQQVSKPSKMGLFGFLKKNSNSNSNPISENTRRTDRPGAIDREPTNIEQERRNSAEMDAIALQEAKDREQAELRAKAEREAMEREQAELRAKAEQEARDREQAELKAKAEQEARDREQAELKAKAEQEARDREQAELRAKAEQEARDREQAEKTRVEQETMARQQAELKARAEQETREREQAELRARAEQEARDREQAELRARAEQEARDRQQAELKARAEQEARDREQAELRARAEQEAMARQQAELKSKEEQGVQRKMEQDSLEEERRKLEQEKLALEEERKKLREQTEQLSKSAGMSSTPRPTIDTNYDSKKMDYKKMVIFVGANKSGTTFMVNAISHHLADNRVGVGVLDMTRDRSLYYIYNQDSKELRDVALGCMQKLSEGVDSYIQGKRNLKIYTSVPGTNVDNRRGFRNKSIIDTLTNNNNLVIVDADFSAPLEYFEKADEIYIVQDLDIMKMQETTLFLRELKNRSVNMNKIRIIINKYVKCQLTPKKIIEGLSYYNDPQMSFVDEILDNKTAYYLVPISIENYTNYIESMYKNNIDYKKYTPDFLNAIKDIASVVYKRGGATQTKRRGIFG